MIGKDETVILLNDDQDFGSSNDVAHSEATFLPAIDARRSRLELIKAQIKAGTYEIDSMRLAEVLAKKIKF